MKSRQGIYLLITLVLIGFAFLLGFFLASNRRESSSCSPGISVSTEAEALAESSTGRLSIDRVNINTATAEQLQTLPGIGPSLAQRIINYRTQNGHFAAIAELTNVEGIGNNRLYTLLDYITLGG